MKNKDKAEEPKKTKRSNINIIGILQLFVLGSVCYSTYVVFLGTSGWSPKVMLIPQALFAAVLAVQKFNK